MRQAQFLSQFTSQPLGMDKIQARTFIGGLASRLLCGHVSASKPASARPDEDLWGDPLPTMQLIGNAAVIPLWGVLSINVPDWIKEYGLQMTDVNDIAEEIDQALADPNVGMIVVNSDSPGGLGLAGDKLFAAFEAAGRKKPVFAWCGDGAQCCSAAYNAVAPSEAVLVGPFAAAVGCIGSYLAMLDDSAWWAAMGISVEVFRSGALKGIGEDALTSAQREYLQSQVDVSGASIRSHVQKYRTEIEADDLQGQWYHGEEAASRGFAAGTAKDLKAALAKFQKLASV